MAERLYMIALSPTMNEGTIARWKVAEGEAFTAGQVLCEVETDKASMDYEASKNAVLLKILLPQGGKANIGEAIAIVGAQGEDIGPLLSATAQKAEPSAASPSPATSPPPAPSTPSATPLPGAAPPPPSGRGASAGAAGSAVGPRAETPAAASGEPRAELRLGSPGVPPSSPLARERARALGLDLRGLAGSGPRGRVVLRDVEAAADGRATGRERDGRSAPGAREDRRVPVSGKRAVIARRLSESFFAAPHFYLKRRVAMDRLLELRASLNAGRERTLSLNAFIVKLCAEAILRHPYVNSSWEGQAILERASIDIALAVALPDGLVTPVVRDCAAKGVAQIDEEFSALIEKARGRGLAPEDYEGSSFTVSNLGSYGVEEFTAIINPPGSAILAVGAAKPEPVVLADGSIAVRRAAALTLGCDHRVIDGAAGAQFLATLAGYFEEPGRSLV